MNDKPVASPCISVCVLGNDDICIGCFRSSGEIAAWLRLDDAGKREVLVRCRQRREQAGLAL